MLPGLGTGYIYQRRWRAYWLTCFASMIWVFFALKRQSRAATTDPSLVQSDHFTFYGIFTIAIFTAVEAAYVVKETRKIKYKLEEK